MNLAVGIPAVVVTLSLGLYFTVITFQGADLFIGALSGEKRRKNLSFVALWQNLGVACTILGVLAQMTELVCIGALFVALGLVTSLHRVPLISFQRLPVVSSGRFSAVYPVIEVPLLVAGIMSLGSLGIVYFFG